MPICLLAVDTATEICGVALAVDGLVKAELILNQGVTHTQSVMTAIETALKMSHMAVDDIDAFAVTLGPGGFTGLRIGMSSLKGLALATAKPMIGISSLEVLAHQAPANADLICPIIDARRQELYWTLYRREESNIKAVMVEQVAPAADMVQKIDKPCFFIGNGVAQYQAEIRNGLDHEAFWANPEENGIRPSVLARLSWQRFIKGEIQDPHDVVPVYLRKSDAEMARNAPKG